MILLRHVSLRNGQATKELREGVYDFSQLNYGAESDLQLYKLKIMELKIIEAISYSKI